MGFETLLLAATPIFGLALELEDTAADVVLVAQLTSDAAAADASADAATGVDAEMAEAIATRQGLVPWHVVFGNLAWASTTLSVVLGFLTYSDRYGFGADAADTPCARGDPILGTDGCAGVPWPHTVAASALVLFYGAAFTTSFLMPDPLEVGEGDGVLARRIRIHRALRWAVLGLVVAQVVFGAINANVDTDFETSRALAGAHLALGVTTWLTMGTQGIVGSLLAY